MSDTNANAGGTGDPGAMSVWTLIGRLRPGQLVAIAGLVVTLVTGAFGFGYFVADTAATTRQAQSDLALSRAQDQVRRLETDVTALRERSAAAAKDTAFLQTKLRFLDLMVLWHQTGETLRRADPDGDDWAQAEATHREVSDNLFRWVMEVVRKSETGEAETVVRARLGKGSRPSLHFEADDTTYRLPGLFATAN